jgi:hypothetical protein
VGAKLDPCRAVMFAALTFSGLALPCPVLADELLGTSDAPDTRPAVEAVEASGTCDAPDADVPAQAAAAGSNAGAEPSINCSIGFVTQLAQVGGGIGGSGAPAISPPPVATDRPDIFARADRVEDALILGNWLLYPSGSAGLIYDSNINQTAANPQSGFGFHLLPSLLAQTSSDFTKTVVYGMVDGRIYANAGSTSDANTTTLRGGIVETYQPLADLILTGEGDYTRQEDLFSTLGNTQNLPNLNLTGIGLSPTANPAPYDQLSAALSLQKNFASAFAILTGSVVSQTYDVNSGETAAAPNNIVYTGTLRGGFWITPALYGYLEGSKDQRDQSITSLNSSGYRIVAGLGTDQIGLLRGEVYAGYQTENYNTSTIGTARAPVLGIHGYYYPLPELTINLKIDNTLGVAAPTTASAGQAEGSTEVTTALASAQYSLSDEWGASGQAGYIRTNYLGTAQRENAWEVEGTVAYSLRQNLSVSLDIQRIELHSNVAGQSFTRDVVTIGATRTY